MPSYVTPKKNSAFVFSLGLPDISTSGKFVDAPTLAAGDVQVSKDGGAFANIASLPSVTGKLVTVSLTATEMDADNIDILFSDAAGNEWADVLASIQTTANQIDDLALSTEIAALNDFDPATDVVANVTLVDTVTTNTDMRGTDNAFLAASYTAPDNASITAILADTDELQANQGDWITATGFATPADIASGLAGLNDITVSDILSGVIEGSTTLQQSMRLQNSAMLGIVSGAATTTNVFRDIGNTKDRITATVDADGNRSAVVLDAT